MAASAKASWQWREKKRSSEKRQLSENVVIQPGAGELKAASASIDMKMAAT